MVYKLVANEIEISTNVVVFSVAAGRNRVEQFTRVKYKHEINLNRYDHAESDATLFPFINWLFSRQDLLSTTWLYRAARLVGNQWKQVDLSLSFWIRKSLRKKRILQELSTNIFGPRHTIESCVREVPWYLNISSANGCVCELCRQFFVFLSRDAEINYRRTEL